MLEFSKMKLVKQKEKSYVNLVKFTCYGCLFTDSREMLRLTCFFHVEFLSNLLLRVPPLLLVLLSIFSSSVFSF